MEVFRELPSSPWLEAVPRAGHTDSSVHPCHTFHPLLAAIQGVPAWLPVILPHQEVLTLPHTMGPVLGLATPVPWERLGVPDDSMLLEEPAEVSNGSPAR